MELKLISTSDIAVFVDGLLKAGKVVVAPVLKQSGKVFFKPIQSFAEVATDYIQTAFSAKEVVFPKVEELFTYQHNEDGSLDIKDQLDSIPETVVWGLRPCDAAGFDYLNKFFLQENPDAYFKARYDKTTLVTISCSKCDESCFCTSVDSHPGDTKGSDILLTAMDGKYYVEVMTEKGSLLITSNSTLFTSTDTLSKDTFLAKPITHFSMDEIKDKIQNAYASVEWKHASMGCFSCGACAFACPTCTCFDIQDEGTQDHGKRVRCWDACGLSQFTKHSSGHNPRNTQTERRRQRLMHKFKYSVENLGVVSCVGCGRCIRVCPSHLNIFENILSVTK